MICIRSLILDYGGVISKPQKNDFTKKVFKILGHESAGFMDAYYQYRGDFDNGTNSAEEYWIRILNQLGYAIDKRKIESLIIEDTLSWTEINPDMLNFIIENRNKVQNLSIISNMPKEILEYINENQSMLSYFDETIYSCEVKQNKPNPRIYELALERIGLPTNKCLFVDDSKANISAAQKIGINTIHFKAFTQFTDELDSKFHLCKS